MARRSNVAAVSLLISASLMATSAQAVLKIKTKSNIKNDRSAAAPANATGCASGAEAFTWTLDDQGASDRPARPAVTTAINPAVCEGMQQAMSQINASPDALAALQAAVDAGDEAVLRRLLESNGLGPDLAPAGQYMAINTKGTGGQNGRAAGIAGGVVAGIVIAVGYDARTRRAYANCHFALDN